MLSGVPITWDLCWLNCETPILWKWEFGTLPYIWVAGEETSRLGWVSATAEGFDSSIVKGSCMFSAERRVSPCRQERTAGADGPGQGALVI